MDDNNEELDEMQAERENRLAEQSGKEALQKKQKEQEKKKMRKVIIKMIIAKIQAALLALLMIGLPIILISVIFVALFDGDTNKSVYEEQLQSSTRVTSLREYLYQFEGAVESSDGKYYKLVGDGAGYPTIGMGIQWASNQDKFACAGSVQKDDKEKEVENVQEFVNSFLTKGPNATYDDSQISALNIYIEKELVDNVTDAVIENLYNSALNSTSSLELSQQQLYALTSIVYNFGYLPSRNGYTFEEVYLEGAGLYEINSWEHNRYIWDNWWSALGGGSAGHIPRRDAEYQTYVKGIYDFQDSGGVYSRNYYVHFTQEQLDNFSYAPKKDITRTTANEEEIFTYNECAPAGGYDGEFLVAAGYKFPHYLQDKYGGKYGTSTIAASGCGPTSMAMILAGFCNDYSITPVTFIENMNRYYNGDWTQYYMPNAGSIYAGICNATFLQEYYNCTSVYVTNIGQALQAISEGKAVIGREEGHILAILPLPDEYKDQGYAFYVLDSARGHSGPFKSINHFIGTTSAVKLEFIYIIQPQ